MDYTNLLGSSTKIPMLLLEYYDQWSDRMEDYLNGIDKDLWRSIDKGPYRVDRVQAMGIAAQSKDMTTTLLKKEASDKRCIGELC